MKQNMVNDMFTLHNVFRHDILLIWFLEKKTTIADVISIN
jgi:hypothetical protein